jgi:hypothetical protein
MSIQTVDNLRNFLADQLERVAAGEITPAVANSQANIAGKMISSVKMQLEYNKMTGANNEISFLGKAAKK